MLRIILIYGAVGAVVVGLPWLFAITSYQPGEVASNGAIIGYASMLVALTAVFLGVKHYRDKERGGVVKFLPALGVGLGISAVASLGWVIGWEIYLAMTHFDFPSLYYASMIEDERAKGATAEKLAQMAKEGADFGKMYANPVIRAAITFVEMFPIGVVVSVLSALLLRNSRFLPARPAV